MTETSSRHTNGTSCGGLSRRAFLGRTAALGAAAAATSALPGRAAAAGADEDLFLLGLEEHFATPELIRLNNMGLLNLLGAGTATSGVPR